MNSSSSSKSFEGGREKIERNALQCWASRSFSSKPTLAAAAEELLNHARIYIRTCALFHQLILSAVAAAFREVWFGMVTTPSPSPSLLLPPITIIIIIIIPTNEAVCTHVVVVVHAQCCQVVTAGNFLICATPMPQSIHSSYTDTNYIKCSMSVCLGWRSIKKRKARSSDDKKNCIGQKMMSLSQGRRRRRWIVSG